MEILQTTLTLPLRKKLVSLDMIKVKHLDKVFRMSQALNVLIVEMQPKKNVLEITNLVYFLLFFYLLEFLLPFLMLLNEFKELLIFVPCYIFFILHIPRDYNQNKIVFLIYQTSYYPNLTTLTYLILFPFLGDLIKFQI